MRKALGRGLDALIPAAQKTAHPMKQGDGVVSVPIEKIRPNHLQPRKVFDPEKLSELAASIREHGLAQPILATYDHPSDTYEIIAGERRLRAAELAGLKEVEVVIRLLDSDKKRLSLAMIENLQREDLNPIDQALGYLRLVKEFGISQTELAKVIGKSKSAVSNTLRLLDLSEEIQKALQLGKITEGHGRALMLIQNTLEIKRLFDIVLEQKLSVRETEDLARSANGGQRETPKKNSAEKPADIKSIENTLQHSIGTKVEIKTRKDPKKGTITIHFYSLDDFEKIVKILKK